MRYPFPDESDLRTQGRDDLIRRILHEGAELHYARLNGSPDVAAEVETLRARVASLETERDQLTTSLEEATRPRKNK